VLSCCRVTDLWGGAFLSGSRWQRSTWMSPATSARIR
jgi:hypothetical protein